MKKRKQVTVESELRAVFGSTQPRQIGGKLQSRTLPKRSVGRWAFVVLVLSVATAGAVLGANAITSLGRPTSDMSTLYGSPLSGFHRGTFAPVTGQKPNLLWIGTELDGAAFLPDEASAVERWPVVKALDQFGSFSNVKAAPQPCPIAPATNLKLCRVATFDWSKAHYQSAYIAFDHKDLLDANGRPLQALNAREFAVYKRFARANTSGFKGDRNHILATVFSGPATTRKFPIITIGQYVQTVNEIAVPGDFEQAVSPPNSVQAADYSGLPFAQVSNALVTGKEPVVLSRLILDVNAEANIMVALICRADGNKPDRVCGRQVIKQILRHVK